MDHDVILILLKAFKRAANQFIRQGVEQSIALLEARQYQRPHDTFAHPQTGGKHLTREMQQ